MAGSTPTPDQWVLLEAIQARTEASRRILEEVSVVCSFEDAKSAMQYYTQLHREQPQRELIYIHTARELPEIGVRYWTGVRTGP